jgi:hypothetical protein
MLPDFDLEGKLPPGVHLASWPELVARFGTNPRRKQLLEGLETALDVLRAAGCTRVYLDGSFVTQKTLPGDYDLAWEPVDVDVALLRRLDPVFGISTQDARRRRRSTAANSSHRAPMRH